MDNELTLFDRLNVIRDVVKKYGEDQFYISFSGGKDSTVSTPAPRSAFITPIGC